MRKPLPARRRSWTQKVKIAGQTFYLNCGEYEDGTLGEVFIDAHKEGTFARGILSALARMISIALQCWAPVADVVKAMRHLNFPPQGEVVGSPTVSKALSLCDWIALELEGVYLSEPKPVRDNPHDPEQPDGKQAGHTSEPWRSGA